jgi:hypothetical protein
VFPYVWVFQVFFPFPSLSYFGLLLYTSCMLRGAFTLFIKFSTYKKKKKMGFFRFSKKISLKVSDV